MLFFLCCRAAIFLEAETTHEGEGKHSNFKVSTRKIGDVTLVGFYGKNLRIEFVDFFIEVIAEDEFKIIRKDKATNKSEKLISSHNLTKIIASELSVCNPTIYEFAPKHPTKMFVVIVNDQFLSTIIKNLLNIEYSQLHFETAESSSLMRVENLTRDVYYDLPNQILHLSKEEEEDKEQFLKWHLENKKAEDEQAKTDFKHKIEQAERVQRQKIEKLKDDMKKYESELNEFESCYTARENTEKNSETLKEIKNLRLKYKQMRIKVEQLERELQEGTP